MNVNGKVLGFGAVLAAALVSAPELHAKWFGERDIREDAGSFLNENERAHFSGIGKIECPAVRVKSGNVEENKSNSFHKIKPDFEKTNQISTAFHVGSFSLLVTNAHAFVEEYWDEKTENVKIKLIDPKLCVVVFYNSVNGDEIEVIPIAYARIRWSEPGLFRDRSNDIALIKLTHESQTPSTALPFETAFNYYLDASGGTKITVVGYHGDLYMPNLVRKTFGSIYKARPDFKSVKIALSNNLPFQRIDHVFVGDYSTGYGSSGSPIIAENGDVIGIHQGHVSSGIFFKNKFNPIDNYNMGILFDKKFFEDVEAMK